MDGIYDFSKPNRLETRMEDYPKKPTPANPRGWEREPMVWNRASFILPFILLSSILRPAQSPEETQEETPPTPAKGSMETSQMEEDKAQPRREKREKRDFVLSLFSGSFFILFVLKEEDNKPCVCMRVFGFVIRPHHVFQ